MADHSNHTVSTVAAGRHTRVASDEAPPQLLTASRSTSSLAALEHAPVQRVRRAPLGSAGREPRPVSDQPRTAALLRLAQRGDGEAFGRIYDRYVDQVYRYLYYRLGSHALAEDLTSETFLRALRRIHSFTWQGPDIGSWFITIARNLANDHVKSSRFRLEVPTGDLLDVDYFDEGVEQKVVDRMHLSGVLRALRELKSEQQECLVLRFLQGLSVAETAEVMSRSEGAVKQLQLRAVRTLAKLLSRHIDATAERGGKNS